MIGFLDQTAIRTDPSRRRVLNTPVIRYTDKGQRYAARSMSIFGFMSLNGKDAVMASERARAVDMVSFLEVVRGANGKRRPILVVLDNATIHRAKITRAVAEDLGIFLAYLPPYSSDLQPIEFGWKDLKRELAAKLNFDSMVDASGPTALRLFEERKHTYSATGSSHSLRKEVDRMTITCRNVHTLSAGTKQVMPICPKCHKPISQGRFQRHLERCGTTHNTKVASSKRARDRAAKA